MQPDSQHVAGSEPDAAASEEPPYLQPGAAVPLSGPALIDQAVAETPDTSFSEAGVPSERVRRFMSWSWGNFYAGGSLSAYLDRMMEFMRLEPRSMRYRFKPWPIMLGFGVLGVALWVLQWWLPELNESWGQPFGDSTGWVRFGMMFIGAWCLIIAWPYYLRKGETPEQLAAEMAQRDAMRRGFHSRIRR